jgi:hypothetical protein
MSESASQIAQAQDQDVDVTKTSRNLPIWEVCPNLPGRKAQARDYFWNADAPVWEMARTSLSKPMKHGIYLLECSEGGGDVLTCMNPTYLIAELQRHGT